MEKNNLTTLFFVATFIVAIGIGMLTNLGGGVLAFGVILLCYAIINFMNTYLG